MSAFAIMVLDPFTLIVSPDFDKPVPADIVQLPENWENVKSEPDDYPTVIGLLDVKTHPLSAFVLPSSTNVKAPAVTLSSSSKSVALSNVKLVSLIVIV